MLWQGFDLLRKAVAVLCMALATLLSAQTLISVMDRIEHAHHHAHFANPLAGNVAYDHHGHSADHRHRQGDGHHGQTPASDGAHQHGDAVMVYLAAQPFILAGFAVPEVLCEQPPQSFASAEPRGPDRPPKPIL